MKLFLTLGHALASLWWCLGNCGARDETWDSCSKAYAPTVVMSLLGPLWLSERS